MLKNSLKIDRDCPTCGKTYQAELRRLKFGRQTTCSRACSYAFRGEQRSNQVQLICAICGTDFGRCTAHVETKHGTHYCSASCLLTARNTGMIPRTVTKPYVITPEGRIGQSEAGKKGAETRRARNNYGHSDETRRKLSDAAVKAIAEGRLPKRSKIKEIVKARLVVLGIDFIWQHPVRNAGGEYTCCFDFYLPAHSAVIEVNGTFWHSDPRAFPDGPKHPIQIRNAVMWQRKLDIAERLGVKIHELWESDLKEDPIGAIGKTLAAIV